MTIKRALATSLLVSLAACGGGGGATQSSAPLTPAGGSPVSTSGSSRGVTILNASKAFTSAATFVRPATTISSVVMHVVPTMQNAAGLAQYAQQASDPTSANYRHFLTAADIGNRFGATQSDYNAVANYFASYGLKVGGWPQRLALTVAGPRANVEKAIGTTFGFYSTSNGHTLLAPRGTVEFSRAIPVASLANVVVDPQARWINAVKRPTAPSQNNIAGVVPQQIATAFDFDSAYAAGYTGSGVTIGIIGTGPAMNADFTAYKAQYGLAGSATLNFPPVLGLDAAANAGGSPLGTPPPVTAPCNSASSPFSTPSESPTSTCNPEDLEAQIDTEQAALARDATIDFYLAYVPVECDTPGSATCAPDPTTGLGYDYQGLAESDDEIQQMIADDTVDVVSGSYGGPEILENGDYVPNLIGGYDPSALLPSEMAALAVEGIAAFFSSGDQGAQTCAPYALSYAEGALTCVSSPSSDENVTAVGGVTIPVNNAGNLVGPITGWGEQTATGGASGGGVSCISPVPPWQKQPSYEALPLLTTAGSDVCGSTEGGRVLPDISLEADPETGVGVVANVAFGGGTQYVYGGTSVAAPEMAAMWAVLLSACEKSSTCATATGAKPYRLGNAAPLLWKLYQTQSTYQSTIYDVTFGANSIDPCEYLGCPPQPLPSGYTANAGWDPVTGLGAPFARHLIAAVVGN
jgi:subtilase family serine protease